MRSSLLLLLLAACTPPVPPPEPEPCGGATLDSVALAAGGRAVIDASALGDQLLDATATGAIEITRDGASITVRGGYAGEPGTVHLSCTDESIDVPVTVEPVAMRPLRSWDATDTEAPPAREYFAWWQGGDGAIYLYGGFVYQPVQFTPSTEAYRLDPVTLAWTHLTSAGDLPPPGGRVAPGSDGDFLYFGGSAMTADGSLDTPPTLATITTDASSATFTALSAAGMPGSYTGSFVHDVERDRWLSVCGADTRMLGLHCKVHAYTPESGFTELTVAGDAPVGRYGFHYALDAETDRVIVFGGQIGSGNTALIGDTWALELAPEDGSGPRWVRLFESVEEISRRRNAAYALDPEHHRLFVWGGTADGMTAVPGMEILELDRGRERWIHVAMPDDVPPRASGGGVYDAPRHRILWGFGNEARLYTDLYELRLTPDAGGI